MDDTMHNEATLHMEQAVAVEAIRDVCSRAEPEGLWEALEARGIETTPGMIYQLYPKTHDTEQFPRPADTGAGLGADDMSALSALAVKAGGMDQLIRILQVWAATSK